MKTTKKTASKTPAKAAVKTPAKAPAKAPAKTPAKTATAKTSAPARRENYIAAKAAATAKPAPTAASVLAPSKNSDMVFDSRGSLVSAPGEASFAFLKRPDVYKEGEPTHKITLTFDDTDPAFAKMKDDILVFENEYLASVGKSAVTVPSCVKPAKDNPGFSNVTFRVGAKTDPTGEVIPVPTVDAKKQPLPPGLYVANGDIARVTYSLGGWSSAFGAGAKPYLGAVQLLSPRGERKGGGNGGADKFEVDTSFLDEVAGELDDESAEGGEDLVAE
jgi:hypothetical protein